MKHRTVFRISALAAAGVLAAGTLVACAGDSGGEESDVIRVTLANHVWTDIIKDKIPEFEKETGLTVELTQLGEDQLSDQYNVKLNAGTDEIDVMMYRPLQEGKLFAQNGYLADLTDRVEENADWDWSDFQAGPVEATTYEESVVGVPLITESQVLYYRTDLLEAAGLEVPETLDDLAEAAETISASNPGVAGFVARTGRSAAVTQFSSFLFSFGGDFQDGEKAAVDSPEAIEAYEYYGGLLHDFGPENVSTDMSWPEAAAIFAQGQAAFYSDASSLYQNLALEENSTVFDKVGYAPFPAGPAGSKPYSIPSWALGINEVSPNQDNAWKFIQWATSFDSVLAVQSEGVPGARTSVWDDPQGTESFPEALAEAIAINAENGVGYDRPLVVNVAESREIVGDPIVVGITGGDVGESAAQAQKKFQAFLDDENE
ncbi:ABC transporter substrate-binding protein [Microbacterium sp. PMB16]|uniref:ABC transporter substrate-binding protein n=1 Tax=Microbacterium sp. PMB16 TaxID=3120157 RepID=UPI003F4C8980